jgi:diaminohydroxyphosphoribosylaminopyrimidine deaminase/5-amino-6-(5-phosphoribosylamino)uracil reductase
VSFDAHDAAALARAVELAERGRGEVEPNPPVGAVLYRGEQLIATGFHRQYGEAHAEAEALAACREVPPDATLAVSLEPCSARDAAKKQPPCVEAIARRGVRRVVIGELDPDRRHQGRALAELGQAGIEAVVAPAGSVPAALLGEFRRHLARTRPYVLLKWAQGLDGKWRGASEQERWISSEASRREVHRLRAHVDAVLIGAGTAIADDPLLTARPPGARPLLRVVLDGRARVPAGARLFTTKGEGPVVWITGLEARAPTPAGVERVELAAPHDLEGAVLPELKRRGVARLLVEGGPTVAAAFLRAGLVDRAWVFVAPVLHGGGDGTAPRLGAGEAALGSTARMKVESVARSGDDAWFRLCWH